MRSDIHQVELSREAQDVTKVVSEVIPSWVRTGADSTNRRDAHISPLARPVHLVRIHEQHLVAVHEILPRVVAVLLWSIPPDRAVVRMVAVVKVDLAGRISRSAGGHRRKGSGRRYPVCVGVVD